MTAWAKLVPELLITDLAVSLRFWCDLIGFRILYERPETGFAFLDLAGAQLMLERRDRAQRQWLTATLAAPFGIGVNFQIDVGDVDPILARLADADWPLFAASEEHWYRADLIERGVRQFLVQDPDGYLLRLAEDLGERPAPPA